MTHPTQQTKHVQALVIGSGISGLFTALKLAEHRIPVLLVTKSALDDSNSRYAQGGIAAVLPGNPEDSVELHVKDTLRAGAGLCDEVATRSILAEGYPAIEDLLHYGVKFDRSGNNQLALTREAAHSINRILHAGGDATGHSVEMTLIERIREHPSIEVMEHCQVVELLSEAGRCYGCRAVDLVHRQEILVLTPHTVLATGGIGRLYTHTTNPAIATGDGIALASRAGAWIEEMEFIQFHPTAFYADGQLHFLISEALRGEGGILRNTDGEAFARNYDPEGELAPRDIVTRFIFEEMRRSALPYVYLDITHLPVEKIEQRFPTILENCLRFGIDIRKEQIPVAPAAHYLMGGVAVDIHGKTSVEGLFAVGETARTGLHGANRLASNSLLECVVLARRVAAAIRAQELKLPESLDLSPRTYRFLSADETPEVQQRLQVLHTWMWGNVGILRTGDRLAETLADIQELEAFALGQTWERLIPQGWECLNQAMVARIITQSALERMESRGAHYRLDFSPVSQPVVSTV